MRKAAGMSARERIVLRLPFHGAWLARNSPARRVPSHGTDLFATTYAIDFVAVKGRRTATTRDWRTMFATEPADRFFAFGQAVLAPADGRVVAVHDGESDHAARRSAFVQLPYALSQASRARAGAGALAGNHVILELVEQGGYVVLAHLRAGSLEVEVGASVVAGQMLGTCGNSGNSTQPHVHIQAMDAEDPLAARGLPMTFKDYRVRPRRGRAAVAVQDGIPNEAEVVELI